MRLDSQRLVWVMALLVAAGFAAEVIGAQGGTKQAAPKPPPPPPPKPAAKPAPQPAAKPATTTTKVVIIQQRPQQPRPRPAYRQPPRNNNNNNNNTPPPPGTIDYLVTFNTDKGKVRMTEEPLQFDEKGNRKKYTAEELKEFKGDTPEEQKMVGFKADFADLRVGDNAKVTLSYWRANKKKETESPGEKDKKDADKKDSDKKDADKKAEDKKEEKKDADAEKKDADKKDADKKDVADKKDASKKDKPAEEEEDGKWVQSVVLDGSIVKIDTKTQKITVRVKNTVPVRTSTQAQPGQPAKNPNTPTEIKPEDKQATLVVVAKRPPDQGTDTAKTK
jgi:hypothetical protein